jgi:uncharacterized phiE125 gp8 family phage protein
MTTQLITPPAALALSIEDGRLAARRTDTALDGEITLCIQAATRHIEHVTGRSIVNRTYEQVLDAFPNAIRLDYPPIASIESVKFRDLDGAWQTLDPADYEGNDPLWHVVPAPGKAWPATQNRINSVKVRYVAGYGPDHATTPAEFKQYIVLKIKEQFLGEKLTPYCEDLLTNSDEKIWG